LKTIFYFSAICLFVLLSGCSQYSVKVYSKWKHTHKSEDYFKDADKLCSRIANTEAKSGGGLATRPETDVAETLKIIATDINKTTYFKEYFDCLYAQGFTIQHQFITISGKKVNELELDMQYCKNIFAETLTLCMQKRGWYFITEPPWFFENNEIKVEELDRRSTAM